MTNSLKWTIKELHSSEKSPLKSPYNVDHCIALILFVLLGNMCNHITRTPYYMSYVTYLAQLCPTIATCDYSWRQCTGAH